jgi:hypothetical protein
MYGQQNIKISWAASCFERARIVTQNILVLYVYQETKQQEPE